MLGLLAAATIAIGATPSHDDRVGADSEHATTDANEAAAFVALDLIVDPGDENKLAAYQVEIVAEAERTTLVGVEGGGPGSPFSNPPRYDPRALHADRIGHAIDADRNRAERGDGDGARPLIILADFTLADHDVAGPQRVARLHFRVNSSADKPDESDQPDDARAAALADLSVRLTAAAGPTGASFDDATASLTTAQPSDPQQGAN